MSEHENTEDLTPEERRAFDALPRERIPPATLEDRVVRALHSEGLLGRRRRLRTGPLLAAAAVAGLALFASGMALGQWTATRGMADAVTAALDHGTDPERSALHVQEAGSEYVRAVARLAELAGSGEPGEEVASGAEAARVALHAAALELARLSPDDATLRLVLAVLEERSVATADSAVAAPRTTIWF